MRLLRPHSESMAQVQNFRYVGMDRSITYDELGTYVLTCVKGKDYTARYGCTRCTKSRQGLLWIV
jgi:hypothetical protein